MTTLTRALELPQLRPDQWAIAAHAAHIKIVCAGRRFGKTVLGGAVGIVAANGGSKVAWIAPTYRNSRPMWRWCESVCSPLTRDGIEVARAERIISFPSGGFIGVYSADNPDSIRGEAFHLTIIDEAARVSEEAWTDAIQPTLADYDGFALLISTPKGKNWFFNEFVAAQSDLTGRAHAWHAPTNANPNPNIRRAFELARTRVSERTFRQEWLAEFVEGGAVFRNVRELATLTRQDPVPGHAYVIGVDWARTGDLTVFAVLDKTTRQLVYLDRFTGIDYPTQAERLGALNQRYWDAQIIAETNAMGKPMTEFLQARGLPISEFTTTAASKVELIDALIRAFEYREIRILQDAVLLGELEAYEELRRQANGKPIYGAPTGLHDDCVMALAFAWWGLTHGGSEFSSGMSPLAGYRG